MSNQKDELQPKSSHAPHSPQANVGERRSMLNSIIIVIAIIMLWRGVWGLLDLYLFPEIPTLSFLVSIGVSLLVLYLNDFHLDNLRR